MRTEGAHWQDFLVSIRIRPVNPQDHERLLHVWRAAVEASHSFLTATDVNWYEAMVAGYLPQMKHVRVAVDETADVVGFLAQDAGEIHMLFVDPAAQRRGVGTALLDDLASGFGVLRLDVNEQNPTARAFYSARGFIAVGRSDTDGQGRPFPLLHLRREHPAQTKPIEGSNG